MYLTRMQLDISKRTTMRALAFPNLFHGAIEQAFTGERKRNLWRIDCLNGNYYLLILSEDKPDLTKALNQFGMATAEPHWETKPYDNLLSRVRNDARWHFRLVANPTRSAAPAGQKMRGRVHAHISDKYQREWLLRQAEKNGFSVKEGEFSVVHIMRYRFRKHASTGDRVTLLSVTFEGVLTVVDAVRFVRAMTSGIGRGKAYGQGLLTIAGEIK